MNPLRGIERDIACLFAGDAASEFEGGGEFGGFGETEAVFFRQLGNGQTAECAHGAVFCDEVATNIDGAMAFSSGGYKQGHEFCIAQRARAEGCEFFARTLVVGHILNPRAYAIGVGGWCIG